jgi:serine/threonine protein kinase
MLLTPGARLGPYEIVAPLGAGGMGEVYKARDTRLDRTVAIKILPAGVGDDPWRQERFRREARAISSLTHAHICTLHDIGEQDGVEFLVMEYLAGETLAHRLLRGALPLEDVLRIAVQLADALDVAHRAGLVHRDLKPANVMLTSTGAKVLDFGLAKWHGIASDAVVSGVQATAHSTLTQVGTVVGTIQYMAPEQVEGKAADARSDLFALGAIVYEMTTGRRAFEGTSNASVMAAILTAAPPPMATLQPVTPPALDHVVKTCLAKSPDERWQAAGDVARELKWISETSLQWGIPASAKADAKRGTYYWIGATALFASMSALLAFVHLREAPIEVSQVRLFIPPPDHAAYPNYNQIESPPVISPDGRQIAFIAHEIGRPDSVWVRPLDSLAARALPGTDGVPNSSLRPFWSPDSRSLGFFAGGKLKRIDLSGGPPEVLADAPDGRGGTWSQQGIIVFAPVADGPLYRVPATGGAVTRATILQPPQVGHRWPVFLPDGRHFLYLNRPFPQLRDSTIDVASLDSADVMHVLGAGITFFNVAYATTGHLLFMRGDTLFAQWFDPNRLVLSHEPIAIAEQLGADTGAGAMFSISSNGILVYRKRVAPITSQLAWLDRSGQRVGAIGAPASQDGLSLSPDGTRVAFRRILMGRSDIWVLSTATGAAARLTLDSGHFSPVWSPDGRHIAFGTQRRSESRMINGVFRQSSSGVGEVEMLVEGRYTTNPTDWSQDGRFIIYSDQDATTKADLWALPLVGDRKPFPVVRTAGSDNFGQLSPDGRWLAYTSDVSGRDEVYVQSFPTATGKWQVSTSGGTQPRWRRDGKELFYVSAEGALTAASVTRVADGIDVSVQKPLFAYHSGGEDYTYAVSRDGRRFLGNTVVSDASQPIVVVLNWQSALGARERR